MKTLLCIVAVITFCGCRTPRSISAPANDWTYTPSQEDDAEIKLLISFFLSSAKLSTERAIFFKTKESRDADDLMISSFSSRHRWGHGDWLNSNVSVRSISGAGVRLTLNGSESWQGVTTRYQEEITILYIQKGNERTEHLTYSWEWSVPNKPSHHTDDSRSDAAVIGW